MIVPGLKTKLTYERLQFIHETHALNAVCADDKKRSMATVATISQRQVVACLRPASTFRRIGWYCGCLGGHIPLSSSLPIWQ